MRRPVGKSGQKLTKSHHCRNIGRNSILPDCARTRFDKSLYNTVHKPRVLKFSLLPAPLQGPKKKGKVQAVQNAIKIAILEIEDFDKLTLPL